MLHSAVAALGGNVIVAAINIVTALIEIEGLTNGRVFQLQKGYVIKDKIHIH